MFNGAMPSARATAGTAVFRIVVSSDCMKNATATSHGKKRFTVSREMAGGSGTAREAVTGGTAAGGTGLDMRTILMHVRRWFNGGVGP